MRCGEGALKKERERDGAAAAAASSVSEFMNGETLVTRGYPGTALLGSMGLTSLYDKIA